MGVIEEVNKIKEEQKIIEHLAKIKYILANKNSGVITYDEAFTVILESQQILLEKLVTGL